MALPLGTGQRFSALKSSLASRPGVRNPGALAAYIGRKKYGGAKMAALSRHGEMGSTGNVLRKKSLAEHITGLRAGGAFGKPSGFRTPAHTNVTGIPVPASKANRTVQPHTGWRNAKPYSEDAITGHRATAGVGTRANQAVTGVRAHAAVHGSQAPKKNAVVGD